MAPHTGWVGLNQTDRGKLYDAAGRTPHGVRGLKLGMLAADTLVHESHPTRGAWIEIQESMDRLFENA